MRVPVGEFAADMNPKWAKNQIEGHVSNGHRKVCLQTLKAEKPQNTRAGIFDKKYTVVLGVFKWVAFFGCVRYL